MAELFVGLENNQKKLIPTSSEARSGNPLGSKIALQNNVVPIGYVKCDGQQFDSTQYPALYAYLGTDVAPCEFDKNRLGDYEEITISTDTNNPTVIEYDGYVKIIAGTSTGVTGAGITIEMYVNGSLASKYSVSSGSPTNFLATVSVEVKKGDEVYYKLTNMVITKTLARFYKHYLCIKATSGLEETQQDYVLQSLLEADSYSTEEVATGKKWIDGKMIYRKTWYSATNWANSTVIGTISNLGMVINITDISPTSNGEFHNYYGTDGTNVQFAYVNRNSGQVKVARAGTFVNSLPSTVIVEYTKAD